MNSSGKNVDFYGSAGALSCCHAITCLRQPAALPATGSKFFSQPIFLCRHLTLLGQEASSSVELLILKGTDPEAVPFEFLKPNFI
jgi:hypothetical protein